MKKLLKRAASKFREIERFSSYMDMIDNIPQYEIKLSVHSDQSIRDVVFEEV